MFTAKGSILLHPILGTHMRHRTVNFSYFFFQPITEVQKMTRLWCLGQEGEVHGGSGAQP